jgi:hypothetical protein
MKNHKDKSKKIQMMSWNTSGKIFICHVDKTVPQTKIEANFVLVSDQEFVSFVQKEKNQ